MLCASNMSALIPPGCAVIQAASVFIPATTPWDGTLAAIFLTGRAAKTGINPQMNTDKH